MGQKHIIKRKSEQKLIDELLLKENSSSQTIAKSNVVRCYLEPRFIIIADTPRLSYNIGRILTSIKKGSNYYDCVDGPISEIIGYPEKYPAVFRKLKWWEYLSVSELPDYVKIDKDIVKVKKWIIRERDVWMNLQYPKYSFTLGNKFYPEVFPSTEEEYVSFLATLEASGK